MKLQDFMRFLLLGPQNGIKTFGDLQRRKAEQPRRYRKMTNLLADLEKSTVAEARND